MALVWSTKKVQGADALCYADGPENPREKCLKPATEQLIWLCLELDLMEISEKNLEEWLFRLEVARALDSVETRPCRRTLPDLATLRAHIGLCTNVAPKTRAKYMAKVRRLLEETCANNARRSLRMAR